MNTTFEEARANFSEEQRDSQAQNTKSHLMPGPNVKALVVCYNFREFLKISGQLGTAGCETPTSGGRINGYRNETIGGDDR